MLCGQSINGGVLNCLRWCRERDCIYYYCYYTVVVIMLCVLEYAVLRSVTGQVQFGEYPVPAKIAYMLSSVAKPDGQTSYAMKPRQSLNLCGSNNCCSYLWKVSRVAPFRLRCNSENETDLRLTVIDSHWVITKLQNVLGVFSFCAGVKVYNMTRGCDKL